MLNHRTEGIPPRIKAQVLVRDQFTCQRCGLSKAQHNAGLEIHHKIKRMDGGTHDLDNLITLCVNCHRDEDRDLTKPKCTVLIELTWEQYAKIKPLYIAEQKGIKEYCRDLLIAQLDKL